MELMYAAFSCTRREAINVVGHSVILRLATLVVWLRRRVCCNSGQGILLPSKQKSALVENIW